MDQAGPVRGVVFDLGGVILRICRTWEEGCRAAGVPVRAEALAEMLRPDVVDLVDRYQSGGVGFDGFVADLAGRSGGRYAVAEIDRVHRGWILGEYPGARELVEGLRAAGVPTVALSNTCPVHWEQMPSFPAFAAIEHRIGSHLVGACKPAAAMYEAAEAALPPGAGRVLFFDDTPPNVDAARARGWEAHVVDPHGDPPGRMAEILAAAGVV
jgi:FMN phosphatase YigB (HAD superfamily)